MPTMGQDLFSYVYIGRLYLLSFLLLTHLLVCAYFVFLVSRDCCVALPCGAMGLSAVGDCGIS